MSWTDIVLLFILAGFVVNGVTQGMLRQLLASGGFIAGLALGAALYRPLAAYLPVGGEPLAFLIIMLGLWVLASLAGVLLHRRGKKDEQWADDLGGALLGLATGVLLLGLLIAATTVLRVPAAEQAAMSTVGAWLRQVGLGGGGYLERGLGLSLGLR
jgi:uncharacterized membrane protein required for colicin V production